MKANLRSIRIAPKKANLIAKMVRGKPVPEALTILERTNKKGARILENLIRSAMANASHNDKQKPEEMVVKTLVVNKAQNYQRGIPMARGRQRIIRKFLSHISLQLGYDEKEVITPEKPKKPAAKKSGQTASQSVKKAVQRSTSDTSKAKQAPKEKNMTTTTKTTQKASSNKGDSASSSTSKASK